VKLSEILRNQLIYLSCKKIDREIGERKKNVHSTELHADVKLYNTAE